METYRSFWIFIIVICCILLFLFKFLIGLKTICWFGIIIAILIILCYVFLIILYNYIKRKINPSNREMAHERTD